MIKFKTFSLPAISLTIFVATMEAQAQWASLKPSLQSGVQIVTETKTRLVLYRQSSGDSLILTPLQEHDSDIYGAFEVKRGGNPYRVWVATEKLFNNPRFAGAAGNDFFREAFLRTLRQDEPMAEPAPRRFSPAPERMVATSAPDSTAVRIEKAGAKEFNIENVKIELAALDSLSPSGKKDSLQISLNQPRQVEQPTEKVFAASPGSRGVRRKLVEVKSGSGYGKIARPIRPRAEIVTSPTLLDSLYQLALAAMEKEDWRRAAFNLEKIQLLQPNYREVVDLLAQTRVNLASAGKPEVTAGPQKSSDPNMFIGGAIAALGAFIALIVLPFIGVILVSPTARVHYHIFRGHYAEAAQIYEKLLARRPGRKKLYPALANLYLRLGRRDEAALKIYEMALQLNLANRHREEINLIVSNYYLTKGRTDAGVIEVLEDALKAERLKQNQGKS